MEMSTRIRHTVCTHVPRRSPAPAVKKMVRSTAMTPALAIRPLRSADAGAGAAGWAQVSRVVWGADDPKKGYRRYSENVFHPKTTVTRGVLREECEALMNDFFAGLRG